MRVIVGGVVSGVSRTLTVRFTVFETFPAVSIFVYERIYVPV